MTTEQLDLDAVGRVLSRLDRQMSDTRVSCVERLLFLSLTASVYAIPLMIGASLVGRTFDPGAYGALVGYLDALLVYAMVAAVVLVPLNYGLLAKTLEHRRRLRRHDDLRVADYLFGRRGRLEESDDARTLLRLGVPALLTGVLIVSVAVGVWSGAGPGLGITLAALAGCVGFFYVQHRCHQLFDFLRRRVDFSREVMTVRRRLEQRRRRAEELNAPVTLSRNMALRLSDLDRMFVLTSEAAARVRAERPGLTGAAVVWDPAAIAEAADVSHDDRAAIESAIRHLSVEIARHRRTLSRPNRPLPPRLESALVDHGLRLEREANRLQLDVRHGRSRTATIALAADDALERLTVTSVRPGQEHAHGAD